MATYINNLTKEYPLYPGDMELRFPNFDENNVPENYVIVFQPAVPEITDTQMVNEIEPVLLDGVWTKQYEVVEIPAEELIRRRQNINSTVQDLTQSGSAPNVIE